jgi:uncharacterized protein YndB with AHSA1/START domain
MVASVLNCLQDGFTIRNHSVALSVDRSNINFMDSDPIDNDDHASTEIDIARTTDDVWSAIVEDPDLWLGDGSTIEPVSGGAISVNDVVTETERAGVVTSSKPGELLELDWWPVSRPDELTSVSIRLTPCISGTRVLITETIPQRLRTSASAAFGTGAILEWRGAMICLAASTIRV